MSAQAAETTSKFDGLKWILAIAILAGGIVAFNIYSEFSLWIRVATVIVATGLAFAVALTTTTGKSVWQFVKESRTELRKVIWPTSNETVRTTIMVIIMVIILALFLWGLDWLINTALIQPIIG